MIEQKRCEIRTHLQWHNQRYSQIWCVALITSLVASVSDQWYVDKDDETPSYGVYINKWHMSCVRISLWISQSDDKEGRSNIHSNHVNIIVAAAVVAIRCNKLQSENNNTRSLKINIYQRTILVRVSYLPLLPNRFHQALHWPYHWALTQTPQQLESSMLSWWERVICWRLTWWFISIGAPSFCWALLLLTKRLLCNLLLKDPSFHV